MPKIGVHRAQGPGSVRVRGKVPGMRTDVQRTARQAPHRPLQEDDRDGIAEYRDGGSRGEKNEIILGQGSRGTER